MDFKVGGSFKMSFINFTSGNKNSFGGNFLEIKPNEFIKYSDKFDDPGLPGDVMILGLICSITLIHYKLQYCPTKIMRLPKTILC
jgi:uncharacterized protein YndB with AHSA1/START domain